MLILLLLLRKIFHKEAFPGGVKKKQFHVWEKKQFQIINPIKSHDVGCKRLGPQKDQIYSY
jgi:hypothetical protein